MSKDLHTGPDANADPAHFNPAGELVRFAEKLLEQGDTVQALECLHEAMKRQPDNLYITAVIERAEGIRNAHARPQQNPDTKALSVTVDSRHPSGIKQDLPETKNVDARIRHLTLVASRLFDRGAFDAAFESLMKAYLLDPSNPLVVACEKQMMPVWNTLRKTGVPGFTTDQFLTQQRAASAQQARPAAAPPAPGTPDALSRLEERKRQLEQQRKEHEQTMWRNASQLPKTMASPAPKAGGSSQRPAKTPRLRDLGKYDRPGFFRWLKGE